MCGLLVDDEQMLLGTSRDSLRIMLALSMDDACIIYGLCVEYLQSKLASLRIACRHDASYPASLFASRV